MTAHTRWMREGILVGLTAFATVAAFYAAFDLLAQRGALYTVHALGVAITQGAAEVPDPGSGVAAAFAPVAIYSALHLAVSLAAGVLVCRLVHEGELMPMQAQIALLFVIAGFAGTIGVIGWLTASLRDVLPWWSIIAANALAVFVAGQLMLRRHPSFLEDLTRNPRFPSA